MIKSVGSPTPVRKRVAPVCLTGTAYNFSVTHVSGENACDNTQENVEDLQNFFVSSFIRKNSLVIVGFIDQSIRVKFKLIGKKRTHLEFLRHFTNSSYLEKGTRNVFWVPPINLYIGGIQFLDEHSYVNHSPVNNPNLLIVGVNDIHKIGIPKVLYDYCLPL